MNIDLLEAVPLGGSTQWIRIRAEDAGNPPLLLVQFGPGLPLLNEVREYERLLSLEKDFTVVYWDQRACGRSLRDTPPGGATRGLSLELMVRDTEELLARLHERFGRPAVVTGFSMGATIAALATARRPGLVAALVTSGMDIDGPAADRNAYEFALAAARAKGQRRAVRQLEAIGPPPHLATRAFGTRVRWVTNFGGVRVGWTYGSVARQLVGSMLRSPDYSLADAVRTLRGIAATQAALVPELSSLDLAARLTRLETPIVMIAGRHDQVAPPAVAERYAGLLEAPEKRFVWFEHSAHLPHFEEPARFREVLSQVRASVAFHGHEA